MQTPMPVSPSPAASTPLGNEIDITILPRKWPAKELEQIVIKYKSFRLHALQSAPGAFAKTYAQEVDLSDERWTQRLTNEEAVHFIATVHDDRAPAINVANHDDELAEARWIALERDWIGSVVLVRRESEGIAYGDFLQHVSTEFHMNALFVHPIARGQGVGERLVFTAREHARGEGREGALGKARITTLVDSWNRGATALYAALGFVERSVDQYVVDGEQREAVKMECLLDGRMEPKRR